MRRKEAYKRMIPNYGIASLAYLITYYEDIEENYEECAIILEAIKEWEKAHGMRNLPKRFSEKVLKDYANILKTTNEEKALFTLRANAKQVMRFVEEAK